MNMNSMLREINILESELKSHIVSDNELIHSHPSGHRNSIIFINKPTYTLHEVIILLNKLDTEWESRIQGKSYSDMYIQ